MSQQVLEEIKLTEDGGVIKQILRHGTGETHPPVGASVDVHYVGTLENGEQFDSSRSRNQPFSFKLGKNHVIKGWDIGVATMKQGELCNLIIQHEYGYGEAGSPPTIPPKATLKFEVELLGWGDAEPETTPEKIKAANKVKEAGNTAFKAQQFAQAASLYQKALGYLDYSWGLSEDEKKDVDQIKLVCLLNLAASHLKTGQESDAIVDCHKALDIDNKNVKALYRKGQAHLKTGDLEQARADLMEAAKLAPSNKEIRVELDNLKKAEVAYKEQQKKMFGGVFERLSKQPEKQPEQQPPQ